MESLRSIQALLILAYIFCLTTGCDNSGKITNTKQSSSTVETPISDNTGPKLQLGSSGLMREFMLTQDSTKAQSRRAKRSKQILILVTAEDVESGIKNVSLDITVSRTCGQHGTNQTFVQTEKAPTNSTNSLPIKVAKQFVYQNSGGCPTAVSYETVKIVAEAENGLGTITKLAPAYVSSFGPDVIRVATFNVYNPGNHPDTTFERWGQQLGSKADILILTEAWDQRKVQLLANAAGLAYFEKIANGDVAIASRQPLYNIQSYTIGSQNSSTAGNSYILMAESDIGGYPHKFIATHWGIRDANNVPFGANTSSPTRQRAAQAIINLLSVSDKAVFVVGDLNAYSGFGPQDDDDDPSTADYIGSTAEVDLLLTMFTDPFIVLQNSLHASNQRIDYVLVRGAYFPTKYETDFQEAAPSDHPFVLVTFEAGDQ